MIKKFYLAVICLLCFSLSGVHYAHAQATTTGNIAGTVRDPAGAVVPHANLVITEPETGARHVQTSNAVGAYTFSDLQVGTYVLTVSAPGFATSVTRNVAIETGRSENLDVRMTLGAATQQVTVSTGAQVLETTTNELASTIKPDAVQDLPLAGRDMSSLTQLAPGSQAVGDARYATFNALPAAAINITVDGMNSNFQKFRTNTSGNYSPAPARLGAIEEVSVSTSDLTADAGSEGAVAERFQIKRGNNRFHASAFWQHQNSALNADSFANDSLNHKIAPFHLNDEGGNVSGPIWKNKVFFFLNYEQEFIPGENIGSASVLTSDAQAGNIDYTDAGGTVHSTNVLDVAAANGFNSSLNPLIQYEFGKINTSNASGVTISQTGTLPYQDTAQWNYGTDTKNVYPTGRLDFQVTPTFDFHVAYDLWWRTLPGTQIYHNDLYTTGAFKSSYQTMTFGADWTITPHLVNQVNAGLLNDQERFNPTNSFNPYADTNNVLYSSPGFTNGGSLVSPYTSTGGLPEPRNNPVRDVFDNLTWNHGNHTFTFGGDFRNSTSHDLSISNPPTNSLGINSSLDPAASMFNDTNFPGLITTGASTPDFNNLEALYSTLTGRVSQISGSNNFDTASRNYKVLGDLVEKEAQTVGGIYMQDAWRPTPHLAINYGMRFQFSGTIHNSNDIYTSPTMGDLIGPSSAEFQPGILGGIQNPQIYLRPTNYTADLEQPAPNAGFAWNPNYLHRNLVFRGGGAISHYDEGWEVWENGSSNNPGLRQTASLFPGPVTNTPSTQFAAGSLVLGGTGASYSNPTLNTSPASFSVPLNESNYTFSNTFTSVDPNIRSPYIENWYLGAQYKLGWNTVLEANYVGNHAVHMWDSYNINEVNIFENGFLAEFQKARADLAANGGPHVSGASFYGADLPIMNQAFGSNGSNFRNSTYINDVYTGQAARLAYSIATSSTNFCNLVGNGGGTFAPCANLGKTAGTGYPINFFLQNPFSAGSATLVSDPASSSYNGLQAQLKHPTGHGLTLMINYAWSHAFSTRYTGASDTASNNFVTLRNTKLNRSPAPSDTRNSLKAYAVYNLPFKGGNYLMKELIGGWTVSPVFTWHSGRNFELQGGTETFNTSDSGVSLNGVSIPELQKNVRRYPGPGYGTRATSTPVILMNPALFTSASANVPQVTSAATPGVFGQFVYLVGPQFVQTDFAISKAFPIAGRVKLNFQTEITNIFNHPNFAVESSGSNSGAQYVSITSSPIAPGTINGTSRNIQFRVIIAY